MTDNEIRTAILGVCKVWGGDSDFNVVGFHVLCDKLKELGAAAERDWVIDLLNTKYRYTPPKIVDDILARGNT